MEYKLIIFDLDGTLVDAYRAIEVSLNHTMRALGYPKRDSLSIRKAIGWGDENLLKPFIKEEDLKDALKIYRYHHKDSLLKFSRLLAKVKKTLGHLKRKGHKLAIASNRPRESTHILLRHLKIDKYFDSVLCADNLKEIKPHPGIINGILKKMRISPEEALYVGDMAIDIQAGNRAKVKTIAVLTGLGRTKQLERERPFRILEGIWQLPELFDRLKEN